MLKLLKKLFVLAAKLVGVAGIIVIILMYCQIQSPDRPVTVFQPLGFSYWFLMDSADVKDTKYSRGDIIFMRSLKEYHTNDDIVFETLQGDYYLGSVTQKWSSLYKVLKQDDELSEYSEVSKEISEETVEGDSSENTSSSDAQIVEVTRNKIKGKIILHLKLSKIPYWSA